MSTTVQCPADFYCPRVGLSAALACPGAPEGSTTCTPPASPAPVSTGIGVATSVAITAVSVAVLALVSLWLYRRWQERNLLQLAHQLFDHKAQGDDELVERRALVRSKVLDLSARIAASDLRSIGAGAFGGVFRGRLVEVDSATGAILRVEDVVVKKPLRVTVDAQLENMQEISLLMGLPRHRHVLGLLGAYTSTDNVVCAVTAFMAGGSLEAQMEAHVRDRSQWAWLTQPMQVAIVVHDMFSGLLHLHTHSIMHRDCTCAARFP
jgi:membrane protein implicated in regulation of membrane protease activity